MMNRKPLLIVLGVALIVLGATLGIAKIDMFRPATISASEIQSEYFSGQEIRVHGTSIAAKIADGYSLERFESFAERAAKDIPELREMFGEDAPTASYELHLNASVISSTNTESIVISEYEYTGGANGMSIYTTFTSPKKGSSLLTLEDIIAPEQTEAFIEAVRNHLRMWADQTEGAMLFTEDVDALTLDSLQNWSLSEDTLTIYFSKYAVGPGALGAIELPIPLTELTPFLQ